MVIQKTSVFPSSRETVFRKLQQLETLYTHRQRRWIALLKDEKAKKAI